MAAIDGKSLCGSHSEDHGPIHMVSAWASQKRRVLGQMKVEEKTNEITAIPELLRPLQIKGCLVTTGAMGCQKDIVEAITEAGANYCLALKGNHQTLHSEVGSFMEDAQACGFARVENDSLQTEEEGHGRKCSK